MGFIALKARYVLVVTQVTVYSMLTLVLPMSSIRFELAVRTNILKAAVEGIGELISIPYNSSWSDREAVYQILNAVLAETRLPTIDGDWMSVSLYNPFSKQVAYGTVPDTLVFAEDYPLYLPHTGLIGELDDNKLVVGDSVLEVLCPGVNSTQKALASHLL